MSYVKMLESAFPSSTEIPENIRLNEPIHQREILINGNFIHWEGNINCVKSIILSVYYWKLSDSN
jgi:glyceraldehyde-3-phosphate dehydrogenase (NADP+)